MNRPGLYKLAGVLLIVVPVCCGLVAIGAALSHSVRLSAVAVVQPTNPYIITRSYSPPTAAQPAPLSPTEARPAPPQAPAPTNPPPQAPAPAPSPVPTQPPPDSLDYKAICTRDQAMTDAQWNEYLKRYAGRKVTWTGWVNDVYESSGKYTLYVTFDLPGELFRAADVRFPITDELGLKLNKDQQITFSGTLGNVESFLGGCAIIEMQDVTVNSTGRVCCQVCVTGKACGDTCISKDKTCDKPTGCACDK